MRIFALSPECEGSSGRAVCSPALLPCAGSAELAMQTFPAAGGTAAPLAGGGAISWVSCSGF